MPSSLLISNFIVIGHWSLVICYFLLAICQCRRSQAAKKYTYSLVPQGGIQNDVRGLALSVGAASRREAMPLALALALALAKPLVEKALRCANKIQTGIRRKPFIDLEWVVYFRDSVVLHCGGSLPSFG
ncbi:MAG: hypothetical protein ACYTXC_25475 [Nostoc sp.]